MRSDQTYEGIHAVSSSQVLADFLDRIHKADDPSVELDLIRAQGAEVSRKKLRSHSGLLRLEYRCSMHSSHNFDRPRINNRGGLLHHSTRNSSKVTFAATSVVTGSFGSSAPSVRPAPQKCPESPDKDQI